MSSHRKKNRSHLRHISTVFHQQLWMKDNFPSGHSSIAITLFLFIAKENMRGEPPSMKNIFVSLGFSEQVLRPHLFAFSRLGFCKLVPSSTDRRVKYVVATSKMIDLTNEFNRMKFYELQSST